MGQQAGAAQQLQLSPEAFQLAAAHQMGTPQAEYRTGFSRANIGGAVLGLLFAGIFGFALAEAMKGGSSSDAGSSIILIALFLLGVAIFLWSLIAPLLTSSWRVYICTDGFIFSKGGQAEPFRWDQIRAMWQQVTRHYTNGIYTGTTHRYTVERGDGHKVVFNDRFRQVESLGNTLSNRITNFMLPHVLAAYNAGNVVNFGPLSVSLQGVSNGRELLPWPQIKEFGVNRGIVTVRKEGKWLSWSSIMVARIPNFFVFMALVSTILKNTPRPR